MYMRVYAFTYMRIWVDSHRVETKREGMVRMAPFISENIDLVPCMAMAFNAAIATMGFLKMVAWTEHGMVVEDVQIHRQVRQDGHRPRDFGGLCAIVSRRVAQRAHLLDRWPRHHYGCGIVIWATTSAWQSS